MTDAALAVLPQQAPPQIIHGYTEEYVSLLKAAVLQEMKTPLTEAELGLFLYRAWHSGLDPLSRQIYAIKRFDKKTNREVMTIQTGIDGYRAMARRNVAYAGSDAGKFVYDSEGRIISCTVTVYELVGNHRCGYEGTAFMAEYFPEGGQDFMWRKMPHGQLEKCAEAKALRKMAPASMQGVYIPEEMDQAGGIIDVEPAPSSSVEPIVRKPVIQTATEAPAPGVATQSVPPSAPPPPPQAPRSDYTRPADGGGGFNRPLDTKPGSATLAQYKFFWGLTGDLGWTREEGEAHLKQNYGATTNLSKAQISGAIEHLKTEKEKRGLR